MNEILAKGQSQSGNRHMEGFMKKLIGVFTLFFIFLVSCATNTYKSSSENRNFKIIGTMQITFEMGIADLVTRRIAYIKLLEAAKTEYHGNIDVRDITWTKTRTITDSTTLLILGYEYTAIGKVILLDNANSNANIRTGIEGSLARAAEQIMSSIQPNSRIAIVYVTSSDMDSTEYIANELEYIMVNRGFTVIDRSHLDKIRQEQKFHLSGEVDDNTAVSIGKIVGANIIITGSITGTGSTSRLRIRALNTETAQVMAVASEQL